MGLHGERAARLAAPRIVGDKAVLDQPFDDTEQPFGLDMFEGLVEIFARLAIERAEQAAPFVGKEFVHRGRLVATVRTERRVAGDHDRRRVVLFGLLFMGVMFAQVFVECADDLMLGHGIAGQAEGLVPDCIDTAGEAGNEDRYFFRVVHI